MASRSLGTLTLDLIARTGGFVQGMDKAGRESAKWRKQVEKDAKAIGKGIGVALGTASAAATALVVTTVAAANEIGRLAQVSNVSAETFQRNAAAAKLMGVEQDKLADIYKDTNDKLGDFMQTGAGPLADFFEQIAPQVGVTAEQFRHLSGPDALQLYVASLEKANVSQNDMTFYMEAIASDATLLLPLLRDNGAGFKLLGDEAQRAGAVLSEDTLSAAEQLNAAMFVMDQTTAGLKNQIAAELLPTIAGLAVGFSDITVSGTVAEDTGRVLSGTIKGLAATAVGAFAAILLLGKGIAGLALISETATQGEWYEKVIPPLLARRIYKNWGDTKAVLGVVGDDLESTAQEYAALLDSIWSAGSEDGGTGTSAEERIKRITEFLESARAAAGQAGGNFRALGKDFDAASKQAEKSAENVRSQITALERAAASWGMSADEVKLYTLEQEGATEAQITYAMSLMATVDNLELSKKAHEDYANLLKDLRTDEEVLTDQMRERLQVLDAMSGLTDAERTTTAARVAGAATAEAPDFAGVDAQVGGAFGELAKVDEAEEKLQEWYAQQLEMLETFRSERADLNAAWDAEELALKQEHEDALAEIERARQVARMAAGEEFFGNMADAAKVFLGENSKLYKAAFLVEKSYAVAKALINAPKSYSDAYAAVVGIPIVGPALAPAAGVAAAAAQVAQAAAIGNIGMAHDGWDKIPKTGSYYLEKGERVTTAETSAKLDATLDRIGQQDQPGPGNVTVHNYGNDRVRTERDASGDLRVIIEAVEKDFATKVATGKGLYSKAQERAYGLKRAIR